MSCILRSFFILLPQVVAEGSYIFICCMLSSAKVSYSIMMVSAKSSHINKLGWAIEFSAEKPSLVGFTHTVCWAIILDFMKFLLKNIGYYQNLL